MSETGIKLERHQLYHFSTCPYCIKVRFALWWLKLELPLKNILTNPAHKSELIAGGGKKQVPCLRIENEKGALFNGKLNFLKTGLRFADTISTVSETYSKEICKIPEISVGLKDEVNSRKKDLYGIVNGIDPLVWNPEKDKKIAKKFTVTSLKNKLINKEELADKFGIDFKPEVPLIGMISRLEDNKGFDLFKKAFKELMTLDIQLVLLGTGEKKYQTLSP